MTHSASAGVPKLFCVGAGLRPARQLVSWKSLLPETALEEGDTKMDNTDLTPLERAIQIAVEAHLRQSDKADAPYILHPLRVMLQMDTDLERTVAVLHDVVEDSEWTLDRLRAEGFSEQVVQALDCLSKRDGEAYDDFIQRVRMNPLAGEVKIADLQDNLDVSRLPELTDEDKARIRKYEKALSTLTGSQDHLETPRRSS